MWARSRAGRSERCKISKSCPPKSGQRPHSLAFLTERGRGWGWGGDDKAWHAGQRCAEPSSLLHAHLWGMYWYPSPTLTEEVNKHVRATFAFSPHYFCLSLRMQLLISTQSDFALLWLNSAGSCFFVSSRRYKAQSFVSMLCFNFLDGFSIFILL